MKEVPLLVVGGGAELVSFLDVDERGRVLGPFDINWRQASERLRGRRPRVLVSGLHTSAHTIKLPNVGTAKLRSVVPFAMEELVATDIELLHFACAPATPGGGRAVLVVGREWMELWLGKLAEQDIFAASMGVDFLALPFRERRWTVLGVGGRVLLRSGKNAGIAVEADGAAVMLRLALEQAGESKPEGIICLETDTDDVFHIVKDCVDDIPLIRQGPKQPGVRHFSAESSTAIDLRQGRFATRNPWLDTWRRWRAAGFILLAWVILEMGLDIANTVILRNERDYLHARTERIFRQTFPETRNLVNPHQQMQHQLQRLRRDTEVKVGFFRLLEAGAKAFARSKVEVRQLTYRNRQLDVEVGADSLSGIDALRGAAGSSEVVLSVLSAASRDGKVTARIRLAPAVGDE